MSIIAALILSVSIAGLILCNYMFAKIMPGPVLFATISMILVYISCQIWIKKVPDVNKREVQAFKLLKYYGYFALAIIISTFLFICIFLIFFVPK